MRRSFAVAFACAVFFAAACSDNSDDNSDATSTPPPDSTATTEIIGTPAFSGLLDDVIGLAVQLNTMTHDEAVCVFQGHPSIYQEFLQISGLNRSGNRDEAALRQQFEDLKRERAIQLDRCFTAPPGG